MDKASSLIPNDFDGKAVLITGGTKGIGLAIGLAFGREGAQVYLTHKWGSADEGEVKSKFAEAGAPAPSIVEADVDSDEDTRRLLETLGRDHQGVEVFISNVAFAQVTQGPDSFRKRSFLTSVRYTAWPLVGYLQEIKRMFGRYPRYAIGTSSDGAQTYYPGYDFVAASKSIMDVLCRYLSIHLFDEDVRINILRCKPVRTESLETTFGPEFAPFLARYHSEDYLIREEEVADAALALCSGLMDAVRGQMILLDRGIGFCDNLNRLYQHRDHYGLGLDAAGRGESEQKGYEE